MGSAEEMLAADRTPTSPSTSKMKRNLESYLFQSTTQDNSTLKKIKTVHTVQVPRISTDEPRTESTQTLKLADTAAEDLSPYLRKIALCQKTPFQKKVLTALCEVPRGRYSTYGAIAKHLSSSPRAVGNALRNNPFAPHVPCHRILASGGGIGGFHGSWGRNGKEGLNDDKKRTLLREEGVKFDGRGKVVGEPWDEFGT